MFNLINSAEPSLLSYVSLVFFIALSAIASLNRRLYWPIFPFVVLTVPNTVNKLFPLQLMSDSYLLHEIPSFSIFTHIDIYLILGILLFARGRALVFFVVILISFFLFVFLMYFYGFWDFRSFFGTFQLRYFLFIYFIVLSSGAFFDFDLFVRFFIAAIVILVIESFVFSYVNGSSFLQSGNLGKNPMGHFFGALFVSFLTISLKKKSFLFFVFSFFCLCVLILNTTKSPLFFAVLSFFIMIFGVFFKERYLIRIGLVSVVFVIYSFVFFVFFNNLFFHVGNWFDWNYYEFVLGRESISSTLLSRLVIWFFTLNELVDVFIFGAGPGAWAFNLSAVLPDRYFDILDTHNDFLLFLYSYGLIFGAFFYYFIIIRPLFIVLGRREGVGYQNVFFSSFILMSFFSGLMNSILWKHQFLVVVVFFSVCILLRVKGEKGSKAN